jgi:aliphatic nitrilase
MIAEGEQIHISSYPPVWPTHDPRANDAYDLSSAVRIRAGAHAFEAKAFNIVASSLVDEAALDALASIGDEGLEILRNSPRGPSMVINPHGTVLVETISREDELLFAHIDLQDCVVPKQFHDLSGYYNRFDVFGLKIDRTRRAPARYAGDDIPSVYPFETMERLAVRPDAAE